MPQRTFQLISLLLLTALSVMAQTTSTGGGPDKPTSKDYAERIAEALRIEVPFNRDETLVRIAFDQAQANRYSDAKATVINYVDDKDYGFAAIVTAQVLGGLYEGARSTLELIGNCVRRAMSFAQIAEAQTKSGDIPGARATLLAGLSDALKEENLPQKRYTLLPIVTGMAAAGLTDDVRTNLKLFDASDRHDAYLLVALAEARRGDLEEARWTFRQAINLEKKNDDSVQADTNLMHIVDAQADVGLIREAKETAAMIKTMSTRNMALGHISLAESKGKK